MTTPNDPIDPIAAAAVTNNDTRGLPPYPSLQRITRTDAVGVSAANKQHKSIERRTDTLLERVNALITAHNLNASNATSYFLKRIGGLVNAMQGILYMGGNKITDLGAAAAGADAPRADQTLTSAGLNVGDLDANGKLITDLADAVGPTDAVNLRTLQSVLGGAVTLTESTVTSYFGVSLTPSGDGGFLFTVPTGVSQLVLVARSGGGGGGGGGGWNTSTDAPDNATAGGSTEVVDVTASSNVIIIPGGGRGGPGQGDDTGAGGFAGAIPGAVTVGGGVSITSNTAAAGTAGSGGTVSLGGAPGLGGGHGGNGGIIGDGAGGGGGGGYRSVKATLTVTPGNVIKIKAGLRGSGGDGSTGGGDPGLDGEPGILSVYFGMLAASQM